MCDLILKDYKKYLEKLCFGKPNDIVKLVLYNDSLTQYQLARLDLTAVSEIKKGKDGAFEIKLIDRIKALEYWESLETLGSDGAESFLKALGDSASGGGES